MSQPPVDSDSIVRIDGNHSSIKIEQWHVTGPFQQEFDENNLVVFQKNPQEYCKTHSLQMNDLFLDNYYKPLYNQLDYKEVFHLSSPDSLQNSTIFLISQIQALKDTSLFVHVKTPMEYELFLNNIKLKRSDVQGENFFPIHLKEGINTYLVKNKVISRDTWFESTLMDSLSVASMYVNGQSNNIFFPQVSSLDNMLTMTNSHHNILNTDVNFYIQNARGKVVATFKSRKDVNTIQVNRLQDGASYLCTMNIMGKTTKQPIVCGDYDEIYDSFVTKRSKLGDDHPRSVEIDELLYRFKFLLDHPTRNSDWWWQFKIPPITYQLEHTFAHLNQSIGNDANEFNLKFVTYRSKLDNGYQRYLLVTPDSIRPDKKYPLVVVIRPHILNFHRFFTSPQFAHQWTINIMQGLANRHGFVVMMPEARMYLDEDITPFSEAEIKVAIDDVSDRYNIDDERIYLHGICSGGYRALKLAALNPDLFAAVAMYAPTYHQTYKTDWEEQRSIESNLYKLGGIPLFIFADPFDRHTPISEYSDLLKDCEKYNIPLTFMQKINTEYLYNAVVVGEEAFDFFDNKSKKEVFKGQRKNTPTIAVADFFKEPFIYVFDHDNNTESYLNIIKSIKKDYEKYFNTALPLIPDNVVTKEMLETKNLFLIGNTFCNPYMISLVNFADLDVKAHTNNLSIHCNPYNERKYVILQIDDHNPRIMRFPWIEGTQRYISAEKRKSE